MDITELKAIVDSEISSAMGEFSGDLASERSTLMDYYLGKPFGNEVEGRSTVVSSDVSDTIEWIMPQIMRVFTATDDVVVFEPHGPEDERGAKQETDYVNYVFYKENNGFLTLYTWFKDALLQKNGVVKYFFEQSDKSSQETYKGLTDPEYQVLLSDDGVEVVEKTDYMGSLPTPEGPMPVVLHDCVIKRTEKVGKVKVLPVPPEEMLISSRATTVCMQDLPFVGHRVKMTVSDLIALGYDSDLVMDLPFEDPAQLTQERQSRYYLSDEMRLTESQTLDPSMKEVYVTECYIRVDFDEDGIAELRKVVRAGNEILLLPDEDEPPIVDNIPFASLTPIIMPHKYNGLSVAEMVTDIQLIKSTLLRQILDNMYLINNNRYTVVNGQVNLDDLLTSRPGGVIRQSSPGMVDTLKTTPFTGHAFGMMEYLDSIKEARTGMTRYTQGLDADSLNKTATGITQIMSAAMARVELIARVFAETGVKELMLGIHGELQKNQNKKKVVKLRGQWTEVDPSEWKTRMNMTVNVGLGTGNKDQMLNHVMGLLSLQEKIAATGGMDVLVTLEHIYNGLSKYIEHAGLKSPELYFQHPSMAKPQQPKPSETEILAQAELQKTEMDNKAKEMVAKIKGFVDLQTSLAKSQSAEQIAALKAEVELLKEGIKFDKLSESNKSHELTQANKSLEEIAQSSSEMLTQALNVMQNSQQMVSEQMGNLMETVKQMSKSKSIKKTSDGYQISTE